MNCRDFARREEAAARWFAEPNPTGVGRWRIGTAVLVSAVLFVNAVAAEPIPDAAEPGANGGRIQSGATLSGVGGFFGASTGAGPAAWWIVDADAAATGMSTLLSLHGGVRVDQFQFGAELAPATWRPLIKSSRYFSTKPVLSASFTGAYYAPLTANWYWPLRLGVGVSALNVEHVYAPQPALFLGSVDVIGFAYRTGDLLLEVSLPAIRYGTNFDDSHLVAWLLMLRSTVVF